MKTHLHESNGTTFHIDVVGIQLPRDERPRMFAAYLTRDAGGRPVPIFRADNRSREVYGSSEAWAVRNARAILDRGEWFEEGPPRRPHQPRAHAKRPPMRYPVAIEV